MNGYQVNIEKHNDRITIGVTHRTTQDGKLRQVAFVLREDGKLSQANCEVSNDDDWKAANAAIETAELVSRMGDDIRYLYVTYHVRVDGTIVFVGMSSRGDAEGLTWEISPRPTQVEHYHVRLDNAVYAMLRGIFTPTPTPEDESDQTILPTAEVFRFVNRILNHLGYPKPYSWSDSQDTRDAEIRRIILNNPYDLTFPIDVILWAMN